VNDSAMAEIDLFFEDPAVYHSSPRQYSVLYLLRRDIRTCLGIHPNTGAEIECKALWPGTMAIMAGIDLLAKFLAGVDGSKRVKGKAQSVVGERFNRFVREYFKPISLDDAETIYQLRNALMHSFGLRSETRSGRVYKFMLTAAHGPLVQEQANDKYWIDILTLHDRFEIAIECYHADLRGDQDLQRNFDGMFPKYGTIYISDPRRVALKGLANASSGSISSFDWV